MGQDDFAHLVSDPTATSRGLKKARNNGVQGPNFFAAITGRLTTAALSQLELERRTLD